MPKVEGGGGGPGGRVEATRVHHDIAIPSSKYEN
jgi:hypothetical protein